MTTIAYKDGVMAGDSSVWVNDVYVGETVKVSKYRKSLVGHSGVLADSLKFKLWYEKYIDDVLYENELDGIINNIESLTDQISSETTFIYVNVEKQVIKIRKEGITFIDSCCVASGSGAEIAIGAMEAGVSAEAAVEIAIRRNAYTSGTVHSVRLD